MNVAETDGRSGMKRKALMRWAGPAVIGLGVFMVFSGLSGLPIHVPYLSDNDPKGYQVVGSGLILFALTLLLVGMLGFYARASGAGSTGHASSTRVRLTLWTKARSLWERTLTPRNLGGSWQLAASDAH